MCAPRRLRSPRSRFQTVYRRSADVFFHRKIRRSVCDIKQQLVDDPWRSAIERDRDRGGRRKPRGLASHRPHRSTTENYGVGLNIDWEIDLWGRLAAQSAAAREDYLASVDGLRAVRQSIAAQTAKSYFAVIEARQKASFSKQALDIQTETARQVSNRVDAGIGAPSDKFLAIANRESSTATLAGNEQAVEGATRQLELLLRDYPRGAVKTASQLAPVPPLPDTGIPASLLERRPDILASARRDGLDNYIDLHLALGGGFDEVAPALPTTLTLIEERFAGSTTTEVSQ